MLTLVLIALLVILDQVTKYLVLRSFDLAQGAEVIPGLFDLRYVQNTGAAWGIMHGANALLIVISVVFLVGILAGYRYFCEGRVHRVAMSLMVAGIVGNLLDRVRYGFVVDFFDFHWYEKSHFPTFNVADAAICIGVGLYVLTFWAPTWQKLMKKMRWPKSATP
jgi:signal peptidase II